LREKLVESLNLPGDLMLGVPVVTLTGHHEAIVINYKGILEYDDNMIRIQTKHDKITIEGNNLLIDYYTGEEMKIAGRISGVFYSS
jgi:sporulation protein YqfC